jgi:7-carboxy-7-deazaguanine synthase
MKKLYLHEEPFVSISGESGFFPQGSICIFLRFQKCNLRCIYCDTVKAQSSKGGIEYSADDVFNKIKTKQVLITGGEPLLAENCIDFIRILLLAGHYVQIETNGSLPIPVISEIQGRGGWVIDRKGPSSENQSRPIGELGIDFYNWNKTPVIFKYVVASTVSPYYHKDRDFVVTDMIELDSMGYKGMFIISPMNADTKNKGVLFFFPDKFRDRVIISLQLHKILGLA